MTHAVTPFGGLAGETVRLFARLGTILAAFPALVATMLLGGIGAFVAGYVSLPFPFHLLAMMIFTSPVVGRYALAAKDGDLESGFFFPFGHVREQLFGFVLRYAFFLLAWGVPLGLVGRFLVERGAGLGLEGVASAGGAFLAVALVGVVATALVVVQLALLVALRADGPMDTISTSHLAWFFSERGRDIPALIASIVGGGILFAGLAVPVMMLVTGLAFAVKMELGFLLAGYTYAAPLAAMTILMGRLCGAFVHADSATLSVDSGGPAATDGAAEARLAATLAPLVASLGSNAQAAAGGAVPPLMQAKPREPAASVASAESRDPLQLLKELQRLAAADPAKAVAHGEALQAKLPNHAGIAVELAKLAFALAQPTAPEKMSAALALALKMGANSVAADGYAAAVAQRKLLKLAPSEFERLGRVLLGTAKYDDAAWCFRAAGAVGADERLVHKGLVAVADTAARDGAGEVARKYYEYFAATYPTSEAASYCRDRATALSRASAKR